MNTVRTAEIAANGLHATVSPDKETIENSMASDRQPQSLIEQMAERRAGRDRSIGAILIDSGKLAPKDAEQVLRLQEKEGLRFGDAAKRLGLIDDDDIAHALARQFDYPYLTRGESSVSTDVVAAYSPFSAPVEALRALRSQLMLRWFDTSLEKKTLAVTSPARGEGRSWLTANLGVVFSQLGERTLIIDADLRHPAQHRLFGLDNRVGLSTALSGREAEHAVQRVPALRDLSVIPTGPTPPNPQELLARPLFAQLLSRLASDFDVILIDTPAGGGYADAQTVAVRASGALVVARKNVSRIGLVRSYADMLRQASACVVGSVLNER